MVSLTLTLVVLVLWTFGVTLASIHNFISFDALTDGETEKLIHFNGVTAKETSVVAHGDDLGQSLRLRQVTDGVHFIQLIYSGDGVLRDCEYIRQRQAVQSFLMSIQATVESRGNVTSLDGIDLPVDVADWLDYQKLKDDCRRNHKQLKRLARRRMHGSEHQKKKANRDLERSRRSLVDYMLLPGTKWCGHEHRASGYPDLGAYASTDKCCRRHDLCQMIIPGFSRNYNHFNYRPFTLSHCSCDRRRKRDLMDMLRVPGTKWCGKGYSAKKYQELGGYGSADKCCRFHDTACPFYIPGLEKRYGLFNWRISSLMHCTCDRRFRSCLKMADTGVANLVGKLFFNVVQTKCFVLKPEKICVKRSWWGKCQKVEHRKQAHIRDNTPF